MRLNCNSGLTFKSTIQILQPDITLPKGRTEQVKGCSVDDGKHFRTELANNGAYTCSMLTVTTPRDGYGVHLEPYSAVPALPHVKTKLRQEIGYLERLPKSALITGGNVDSEKSIVLEQELERELTDQKIPYSVVWGQPSILEGAYYTGQYSSVNGETHQIYQEAPSGTKRNQLSPITTLDDLKRCYPGKIFINKADTLVINGKPVTGNDFEKAGFIKTSNGWLHQTQ